jgi:glycosyltransferase involved in cell wall biosynthesis
LKVLFVGSAPAPEAGGAHGFVTTVKAALEKTESQHTLHFATDLKPGYDFTWFLSPSPQFAVCTTPFAFTVWDLGHRTMPWFPEVSLSGWKFASRQERYSQALPRASIVVCSSEAVAEQCKYYYHPSPNAILVLPEPPSPVFGSGLSSNLAVLKHNLQFEKYLLYPAQFWPHKNHTAAIDALKILLDKGEDFRLVLTGSDKGNRQHVFNYARTVIPDPTRIVFAGFVTVLEMIGLYENAFATVIPTLMPACSLPVFEAGACGCPVAEYTDADKIAKWVLLLKAPELRAADVAAAKFNAERASADKYAEKVINALNAFSNIRRLWGQGYTHL